MLDVFDWNSAFGKGDDCRALICAGDSQEVHSSREQRAGGEE